MPSIGPISSGLHTLASRPHRSGVNPAHDHTTAGKAPGGVRALSNLVYLNQGGRQEHLDLYLPTGPKPPGGWPVILALPGGGWRWVRRSDLGSAVAQFARYGYAVAVADYAFAGSRPGSHVWPKNVLDVRQAVRWLRSNSDRFGLDPNRFAAWGESAGGHLASLLGTDPDGPIADAGGVSFKPTPEQNVSARVQAVVDFYGPTDLAALYQDSPKTRPYLATFLGGPPTAYPQRYTDASPVDHVSPDAPPFLIYQGSADTANVPDQSGRLAQALRAAGVPVHIEVFGGLAHGFRLVPARGINLVPQILAFLDAALNRQGQGIA
jgi:acetyl esterase/lipase